VQIVVVVWTKRARGGPLATRRNSVPERFVLPKAVTEHRGNEIITQTIIFNESNDFAAPTSETVRVLGDLPVSLEGCIQLVQRDDTLVTMLTNYAPYVPEFPPGSFREHPGLQRALVSQPVIEPSIVTDYRGMGAPGRSVPLIPLVLRMGEWGQLRYLGRHAGIWSSYHVYKKYVYNIGWLQDVSPRLFIDSEPHHRYDSMPDV
jgi:hypothetical protein